MSTASRRPRKIAILGGGVGALTAAYWLTEKPRFGDDYEITVYQMGWRLGGKGASGRNIDPKLGARIEEHGLHIWFGCYENAFRTIKRVLDQLHASPEPPVATFRSWRDAFAPNGLVVFGERAPGRTWRFWDVLYPHDGSEPGTGDVVDFWPLLRNVVSWLMGLRGNLESYRSARDRSRAARAARVLLGTLDRLVDGLASARLVNEQSALFAASLTLVAIERLARAGLGARSAAALMRRVEPLLAAQRRGVRTRARRDGQGDPERARFWILTDLGLTAVLGLIKDEVFRRGWESIDREDLRAWLTRHGASPEAVRSTLVETFYDLAFAYEEGDTRRPNFAAGTALYAILRVCFTYNGALMYEMQAGMGDTIFTPLYGLLRERGVRFEFFHKVERLEVDRAGHGEGEPRIGAIRILEQATVKPEVRAAHGGYWPLVRVGELDCWPSEPDWSQLVEGGELLRNPADPGRPHDLESYWSGWKGVRRKRLVVGRDFDEVVFGLSLGAVPVVCKPLLKRSARWRRMIEGDDDGPGVQTTRTQGVQLWFKRSTEALGFVPSDGVRRRAESAAGLGITAVLGGYEQPLDTWADLTHLLARESWRGRARPASLAYLCGPFPDDPADAPFSDHEFPRRMREEVERRAIAWLERFGGALWPLARSERHPTGVDPREVHDPWRRAGMERFGAQFYKVNVDPTERYVLSVAGSTHHRLDGVRCGFANLFLAGDWTRNPVVSVGCVEAAVASGMEVARALGKMDLEIVGERPKR